MSSRRLLVAGICCAALVAALMSTWVITHPSHPTTHRPVPLAANPFPVAVSVGNGELVAVGDMLHVHVTTTPATHVRSVTLYDGARRVATSQPTPDTASVSFPVPALDPGNHAFTAQLTSTTGQTSSSAPDPVVVAVPRGIRTVHVAPVAGETQAAAAVRLGVAPTAVRIVGPRGSVPLAPTSTALIASGSRFEVTVPKPPTSSPLAPAASTLPPAADGTLTATLDGCSVHVTTTSGNSVTVERASATSGGYTDAGSVSATSPLTLTAVAAGQLLLEGRIGDALTGLASVDVPDSCDPAQWTGNVSIRHGLLVLPHPVGQVYLYLGVDNSRFTRVPQEDAAFIDAGARVTPIADQLPQLVGRRLVVEAWQSPNAGSAEAALVGRGELTVPEGVSIDDAIGLPSTLTLASRSGTGPALTDVQIGAKTQPVPFVAHTDSAIADRIVWQILLHPLSQANHDLDPIGLLGSGRQEVHGGYSTFALQSNLIPRRASTPVAAPVSAPAGGGYGQPVDAGSLSGLTAAQLDAVLQSLSPASDGTVYVRALAFSGPNALDLVSNLVTVRLPPTPVAPKAPIPLGPRPKIKDVRVRFPAAPNPDLTACVHVTSVPWRGAPSALFDKWWGMDLFYPQPGTYCPSDFPVVEPDDCSGWFSCALDTFTGWVSDAAAWVGDAVSLAVHLVEKLWDLAASLYNEAVKVIKTALAKFNPVCLAARAASSSAGKSCEDIASVVSSAAVNAVLESYGLPPSIPTSAQVEDIAKGDLSELAVQYMNQLGIPCDEMKSSPEVATAVQGLANDLGVSPPSASADGSYDVCHQVAQELVGTVSAGIVQQAEISLAAQDGLPYAPFDGFVMTPEAKGQLQPVTVQVDATGDWADKSGKYTCPVFVQFTPPSTTTKPLYKNAATMLRSATGRHDGHGPWLAYVSTAINSTNPKQQSAIIGLPITVRINGESDCLLGGARTVTGKLGPPQPR